MLRAFLDYMSCCFNQYFFRYYGMAVLRYYLIFFYPFLLFTNSPPGPLSSSKRGGARGCFFLFVLHLTTTYYYFLLSSLPTANFATGLSLRFTLYALRSSPSLPVSSSLQPSALRHHPLFYFFPFTSINVIS